MRSLFMACVTIALFTTTVYAGDFKISDKILFRTKGTSNLFLSDNRDVGKSQSSTGSDTEETTFLGEGSMYWLLKKDKQLSKWLIGVSGGYLKSNDRGKSTPPSSSRRPNPLNQELAFGAASIGLLNREASILRADIHLDLGVAYRNILTTETMFFSRLNVELELSLSKPFGLYAGISGRYLQGKSERWERSGRADFGVQLWQTFAEPHTLHFRHVKLGGYIAENWLKDRDTPFRLEQAWFQVGPRATLDFGTLVINIEAIVPGSSRRVWEKVGNIPRRSTDRNSRPLGASITIEIFF